MVPARSEENLQKLVRVLARLEAVVEEADEFEAGELPDPMLWLGDGPLWEELSPSAVKEQIGGIPIKFVSAPAITFPPTRLAQESGRLAARR